LDEMPLRVARSSHRVLSKKRPGERALADRSALCLRPKADRAQATPAPGVILHLSDEAPLKLLGESEAFVLRDHQRAVDLMACGGQVAPRCRSRLFVLFDCEKDAHEAALIAALAQERDRRLQLELTGLRGDALVRFAEDVLGLQTFWPQLCIG